jgi:hypothetical protein
MLEMMAAMLWTGNEAAGFISKVPLNIRAPATLSWPPESSRRFSNQSFKRPPLQEHHNFT